MSTNEPEPATHAVSTHALQSSTAVAEAGRCSSGLGTLCLHVTTCCWQQAGSSGCISAPLCLGLCLVASAAAVQNAKLTCSRTLRMRPPRPAFSFGSTTAVFLMCKMVTCCRLLSVVASGKEADAYEVLDVEPTATSGEIKKRYWRLSLLIHPDKCAHPRANDAFQAVSKVSKDLQVRPAAYLHLHKDSLLCKWCWRWPL